MNKSACLVLVVLLIITACKQSESISLNDVGVPISMAEFRAKQVSDVVYKLSFDIPDTKEAVIPANLELNLTINDLSQPLYLDFKEDSLALHQLWVNDSETPIVFEKEHLVIPAEALSLGANKLRIDFTAGDLSLNRNADYLYTLLVPDRARTLFPCFDQPNIKANYQLTITAPSEWKVLCGAPMERKTSNDTTTTYEFGLSDLMSTYLFSFVAGKFTEVASEGTARPMNLLYRETNPEKIEASVPMIFDLHQSSLNFLEDYTQYPYPYKKFDFATIPGFQYGGMEHTGAIQYRESTLFLDATATRNQELSRAKLIAHETSHMWFGNLVTMDWFNDVWMKEVFANFMADKIVNPVFTDINHELLFLISHYPSAFDVDRTQGTNPIRQDLDNLKNAGSLYGSIIYNKAPIMMRQLELVLGEARFKEGIRDYIKKYANGNADWNGLVDILDEKTPLDLKSWSEVWVNSTGRPIFMGAISYDDDDKIAEFNLMQQAEDGSNKLWPQTFDIALVYTDTIKTISVASDAASVQIKEALGLDKPSYVLYNSNGYGYGIFPIDDEGLLQTANIQDEVTRAQAYINNYEQVLNASVDRSAVMDQLKLGIASENNELILSMISGQLTGLYWYQLSEEERSEQQAGLEEMIYNRLKSDVPKNSKKVLFNAYRSIANSSQGLSNLYRIWNKEEVIDNLLLNEDDNTRIAQTLAFFGHPNAEEILITAKSQITNPDKIERFEFLTPALSSDAQVRNTFFESFKEAKNREKENWVQSACYFIHHPLNQADGIKVLGQSLELLEEIQQTGDIFFPTGWLNSTIGQYNSTEAYSILTNYLSAHPNLDANLLKKLLQASDNLYRKHGTE